MSTKAEFMATKAEIRATVGKGWCTRSNFFLCVVMSHFVYSS